MADVQAAADRRRGSVDRVDVLARLGAVERVGVVGLPLLRPLGLQTLERGLVRYDDGAAVGARRGPGLVVLGLGHGRNPRARRGPAENQLLAGRGARPAPDRAAMEVRLEFYRRPARLPRRVAGTHLAADPVLNTVVVDRDRRGARRGRRRRAATRRCPRWWAVVRDEAGDVAGVGDADGAVRAVPALPAADAGRGRACRSPGALHERGEEVGGVNGALPAGAGRAPTRLARLAGGRGRGRTSTRGCSSSATWSARRACPGRLRRGRGRTTSTWRSRGSRRSTADADEQAGRPTAARTTRGDLDAGRDAAADRRTAGCGSGRTRTAERVHLTGANPPSFGVARVGPVYTPREHRGRGYASAAVAEVSRRILEAGRPGLPVHRPGQPDLEQDLRGARLPAGRRHGEPPRQRATDRYVARMRSRGATAVRAVGGRGGTPAAGRLPGPSGLCCRHRGDDADRAGRVVGHGARWRPFRRPACPPTRPARCPSRWRAARSAREGSWRVATSCAPTTYPEVGTYAVTATYGGGHTYAAAAAELEWHLPVQATPPTPGSTSAGPTTPRSGGERRSGRMSGCSAAAPFRVSHLLPGDWTASRGSSGGGW